MISVAAAWGGTYVMVKDAITYLPVADFLTWRFAIATAAVAALRPRTVLDLGRRGWGAGVALGLLLAAAYALQTVGLRTIPASVSGFITGLLVVLTPLVAALWLRERLSASSWFAVGLATAGLCLLSLRHFSIGTGEALTAACALALAAHIVGVSRWSSRHSVHGLVVVQMLTVTVASAAVAVPRGIQLPREPFVWFAILFTALVATALAYFLQTWAQVHISASRTAVILTLEPVFALLAGVVIAHERLGLRAMVGAACVLIAMIFSARSGAQMPVPWEKLARGRVLMDEVGLPLLLAGRRREAAGLLTRAGAVVGTSQRGRHSLNLPRQRRWALADETLSR